MTGDKSSDVRDPETLHCPQHSSCLQLGSGRWCQEGVNLSLSEQNNSFLWSLLKQNDLNLSDVEESKFLFFECLSFHFLYLLIRKPKLDNIKWEMEKWETFKFCLICLVQEQVSRFWNFWDSKYCRLKRVFHGLFAIFLSHKMFYDKLKMWHPEAKLIFPKLLDENLAVVKVVVDLFSVFWHS